MRADEARGNGRARAAGPPGYRDLACYPETRIGAFDFYAATRTEPPWSGSADVQRACGGSWLGGTEDLCCFIQEDPIATTAGDAPLYTYVDSIPTTYRDPSGKVISYVFPPPMPALSPKPGPAPDFGCCSKSAIKEDLKSVEYQIGRMIRGLGPLATKAGPPADQDSVTSTYDPATEIFTSIGSPANFDTSIPSGGDPCVKYCGRYHEWVHHSDRGRRYAQRWSYLQIYIFTEWPAYVVNAACLRAAEERAKKP